MQLLLSASAESNAADKKNSIAFTTKRLSLSTAIKRSYLAWQAKNTHHKYTLIRKKV
jgi:hypothetical protein